MPHNHRMWAVIGIYTGREDNVFWRRVKGTSNKIEAAGAKALCEMDAEPLGADIIHSVINPINKLTGAIHIYGGNFFAAERSEWDSETLLEHLSDGEQKGETWEGGYRAPMVVRWPGHIKPGTVKDQMFASLDWLPTLVEIAGGAKGNDLKAQIEKGSYPGIVKTTLDGVNQLAYLEGKSENSARDYFFYYAGATPSAVRYKNWKFYYTMAQAGGAGWFQPPVTFHWTLVANIKRDPFEQAVGFGDTKSNAYLTGQMASPSTSYLFDWNLLPMGQLLWEKELMSYSEFPPLQAPETYNLSGILKAIQAAKNHPSD